MDGQEKIRQLYVRIVNEIEMYDDYVSEEQIRCMEELYDVIQEFSDDVKKSMAEELHRLIDREKKYTAIWLYSSCMVISSHREEIVEEFLQYIIECRGISPNTRFFLYYQMRINIFQNMQSDTFQIKYLRWKLLETVVSEFRKELQDVLAPVPKESRNEEFVLVVSEQVLGPQHGPTKIAWDRSKVLMQDMGKTILLINTAELCTEVGRVPFLGERVGGYNDFMLEQERISWKGVEIPYFQCEANMPNMSDLRSLFQMVQQTKPGMVIAVGGSGILANLLNDIIPVLMVGLSPSDLCETTARCQTLSRPLLDTDKELLRKMGMDESSVIESIFTSSIQPQEEKVSRAELGIPEDKFVIAVVGYRLDRDIDSDFVEMLKQVVREDIYVALIGKFSAYEKLVVDNPELKDTTKLLGLTMDILAWIENCDLYVNPYRKGGGTSGVEAIFKGIPVVTIGYGDVAINVGQEFWVESYNEMPELILRYKNDAEFYQKMSERAKARAEILLDSEKEFVRVVEEFKRRTSDR